jgi:hypothetical protein
MDGSGLGLISGNNQARMYMGEVKKYTNILRIADLRAQT